MQLTGGMSENPHPHFRRVLRHPFHPDTKGNHHGHLAYHRLLDRPRASAFLRQSWTMARPSW